MGRWTQYDEDDYRLPEGMKRVGYDSDTGRYYFRDKDGSLWEGAEGAEYGEMRKVEEGTSGLNVISEVADDDDVEAGASGGNGYQPLATDVNQLPPISNTHSYRSFLPFFLLICVFLLLVFRIVRSPSPPPPPPDITFCPGDSQPYRIIKGDTCWGICQSRGCEVDSLKSINPSMDCDLLKVDEMVCLPEKVPVRRRRIG